MELGTLMQQDDSPNHCPTVPSKWVIRLLKNLKLTGPEIKRFRQHSPKFLVGSNRRRTKRCSNSWHLNTLQTRRQWERQAETAAQARAQITACRCDSEPLRKWKQTAVLMWGNSTKAAVTWAKKLGVLKAHTRPTDPSLVALYWPLQGSAKKPDYRYKSSFIISCHWFTTLGL